jgi:hypothetical protein
MPRFMSDEEYENEKGDVEAVAAKADAFIQDLQGQLEGEKAATADLEEKLHTVVLLLPGFTSMAMAIAWVVLSTDLLSRVTVKVQIRIVSVG